MKKCILYGFFHVFFISLFITNIQAQVNVTATLATPAASYTTLKGAFDAINAGTHQGVISIQLTANTTETASCILNASGSGAAAYTNVNITATAPVLVTGNIPGALIRLNGADNVTIDGRIASTGRNITIENTNTAAASAAVWLSSNGAAAGCINNVIRNCEIKAGVSQNTATTLTYGVIVSGTSITTTSSGADNDNNQFIENRITKVRYGILIRGESAANPNENTVINNNLVGPSAFGLDEIGKTGIYSQFENNCTISRNNIGFVGGDFANTSGGADRVGIALGADAWPPTSAFGTNYSVFNNVIHDIVDERTFAAVGILNATINSSNPTNNKIYNNFIYYVKSNGTATDQGIGIGISGAVNDIIAYNSILMYGDVDPVGSTTATQSSAGIRITSATPANLTIKNNNISVDFSSNTATLNHYCIIAPSAAFAWGTGGLNNNNYYYNASNPQMKTGGVGTATPYTPFIDLAAWKANFSAGQDHNSFEVAPGFVSATDLHLTPAAVSFLESGGTTIAGINTDIDGDTRPGPAGSVNGGGTAPDIGADEFDGTPVSADVGITQLVMPGTSGCHGLNDSIIVRLQNFTPNPVNFATDTVFINAFTTGANPVVIPPVLLTTGTLAGGAFMDVLLTGTYNIGITGTHTFHAIADLDGDNFPLNDTMPVTSVLISGGTAVATGSNICVGSSASVSVSGYTNGGSIQWQSSPDNTTWTNIIGATSSSLVTTPTDTIYYRAMICGLFPSVSDTVNVINLSAPVASNATRCGYGTVTLSATGVGLNWYDAPSGGTLLGSGPTYTTPVLGPGTSTYYVSSSAGSSAGVVGPLNPSVVGAGGYVNYDTYKTFFTVTGSITLSSVDIFAQTIGVSSTINIVNEPSGTVVASIPYTTTVAGSTTIGQTVTLDVVLAPGNYSMKMGNTNVSLYRNTIGSAFPYTLPSISITGQSFSGYPEYYYYFYNWKLGGCESARTAVTVNVTPSDTIIASITTNPICANQSTPINVTSTEPGYQYTWSPATGLNTTTGSSVITSADTNITYTIHALDPSTGCESYTTASVSVLDLPSLAVTPTDTTLCAGSVIPLNAESSGMIVADGTVGAGLTANTATSTTILGPYGGYYGGSRHQYLVLASDLVAAGITAGPINYIQFEVTALNGVPALTDYTIKAGPTALAVLTPSFVPGLPTLHYSSSYTPVLGWNSHPISPLVWDGISNIVVEVCFNNNNGGAANGNASVRYTPTSGTNTVNYFRANDDPNVCAMFSGTVGINRPNIRFSRGATILYQWTPAANLSADNIANPVLTANTSTNYTITVTDDSSGCFNTTTLPVIVNPVPVFTIGNDTALCSNGSVTGFFLGSTNTSLFYTWQDSSITPAFLVTEPGVYYATGTDANGCSSTDTVTVIAVDPSPVDININITTPNTAILDAGAGYAGYSWYNSAFTQTITITGNGTYWVTVTDLNGCTNSDTVSIIFSLGINTQDGNQGEISFYPNPSNGMIWMAGKGLNGEALKVEILDLNGRALYLQTIEEPGQDFTRQIDLSTVAEGTYLIRISSSGNVYTSRIIIAGKQ